MICRFLNRLFIPPLAILGPFTPAVGATGEGAGCSLPDRMTFGSVEGGAMSTFDPGSMPSVGSRQVDLADGVPQRPVVQDEIEVPPPHRPSSCLTASATLIEIVPPLWHPPTFLASLISSSPDPWSPAVRTPIVRQESICLNPTRIAT